MTTAAKLPLPPHVLTIDRRKHVIAFTGALWRVHATEGDHPQHWDELRTFGPIPGMRFDPQPPPMADHPGNGVMYTAASPVTAIAEVYQETRVIDRGYRGNTLAGWQPTRTLELLDLTSRWPVANKGVAAMQMSDKERTSAWSSAINAQFGAFLDGLYHHSSVDGQVMITLFNRSEMYSSFPSRPSFSAPLSSAACDAIILDATDELDYLVL